jgi:hypothetical protein
VKVYVDSDEWYPVYGIADDAREDLKREISDEIVTNYRTALTAFEAAHKALHAAWVAAGASTDA